MSKTTHFGVLTFCFVVEYFGFLRLKCQRYMLCTYQCQARGGKGAVGNLTVTYIPRVGILIGHHSPRVGNFIAFLLCATRTEGDFDTFDNYFLPGGGDFDNFFQKMSKSPPYSRPPPPSGLTLIGALEKCDSANCDEAKWSMLIVM